MLILGNVRISKGYFSPAGSGMVLWFGARWVIFPRKAWNRRKQSPNLFSLILDLAFYQEVHLIRIMYTLLNITNSLAKIKLNSLIMQLFKQVLTQIRVASLDCGRWSLLLFASLPFKMESLENFDVLLYFYYIIS